MENRTKKVFDGLTGYRAVAAIFVVFYHNGYSPKVIGKFLNSIQHNLNVGVSFFFVLSGFLITYRYYQTKFSIKWFITYMRNRFARIYPVYGAYCIFVSFAQGNWTFKTGFYHFSLLVGIMDRAYRHVPHAWSLTVEENFYILAPLIFLSFRKRRIIFALIFSYVVGILLWGLGQRISSSDSVLDLGNYFVIWRDTFFGRALEFFTGAWLAVQLIKKPELLRTNTTWKWTIWAFISFFGVMGLLSYFTYIEVENIRDIRHLIKSLFIPIPAVLFIYCLMTEKNYFTNLLSSRLFVILGKSSYILYLIHLGPIGGLVYGKFGLGPFWGMIFFQVLSVIGYYSWERPWHNRLRASH